MQRWICPIYNGTLEDIYVFHFCRETTIENDKGIESL